MIDSETFINWFFFSVYNCVHMYHVHVVLTGVKEGVPLPVAGATGSCEPPPHHVDAVSGTLILWEDS